MDVIIVPLFGLAQAIIGLYIWVVLARVIFSWLISFNVINTHNQFVAMVGAFLYRATEPLMAKIREFLPTMGGLDLSPLVVIFGLYFIQNVLTRLLFKFI